LLSTNKPRLPFPGFPRSATGPAPRCAAYQAQPRLRHGAGLRPGVLISARYIRAGQRVWWVTYSEGAARWSWNVTAVTFILFAFPEPVNIRSIEIEWVIPTSQAVRAGPVVWGQ